jgi:hypothetical protein
MSYATQPLLTSVSTFTINLACASVPPARHIGRGSVIASATRPMSAREGARYPDRRVDADPHERASAGPLARHDHRGGRYDTTGRRRPRHCGCDPGHHAAECSGGYCVGSADGQASGILARVRLAGRPARPASLRSPGRPATDQHPGPGGDRVRRWRRRVGVDSSPMTGPEWQSEWLSAGQVERALGISATMRRAMPPADLPYMRLGQRGDRRYRVADVQAYIARRMVGR